MSEEQYREESSYVTMRDLMAAFLGFVAGSLLYLLLGAIMKSKAVALDYGYPIFFVTPFFAGLVAGLIAYWDRETTRAVAWGTSIAIYFFVVFGMMILKFEGIVCLLMAAPLAIPFIALGVFLSRALLNSFQNRTLNVSLVPLAIVAGIALCLYDPGAVVRTESSSLVIDATPDKIWPYLFELHDMPSPESQVLRIGVAYPMEIRSVARQVGAERDCVLSTGVMKEHISMLEENRLLRFDVESTPIPLKETNPFGEVHAAHEHGYYDVRWGEFGLDPLPGGRTLVTGTSQYSYRIFPGWYWGLINDTVVEQVHMRVMREIKRRVSN